MSPGDLLGIEMSEARLPGLRWLAVALTWGRSDNGNIWGSFLGPDLVSGLWGSPVSWYSAPTGRPRHVPTTSHMMAVHREHEIALVESAWTVPHGVFVVLAFYLPLSPSAERARRELLEYEGRGALLEAPGLSIMARIAYRPSGFGDLRHISRLTEVNHWISSSARRPRAA